MEHENRKSPLVSVIIATYNRSRIISQAIESVLGQTFRDYEIIVVDDGGSDGTEDLLRSRFAGKILTIRKDKNEGLSAARNTGIKASRGTYIALLDDDDCWLPEKLELQVGLIEQRPSLGLVYCNSLTVNEYDEVLGELHGVKRGTIFQDLLASNCLGPPSGVLIAKTVFERSGYFDENLTALEDWDMWIRVAQLYEIDFVDRPLVCYRVHSDNMSRDIINMQRSTFAVLDKYWPHVCKEQNAESEKNRVYSNHYVNFAWKQYSKGNREAFKNLVLKALQYDPFHKVVLKGDDLSGKEKAFFEVFNEFWNNWSGGESSIQKKRSYSLHYIQLAWEYYHCYDLKNFRRSILRAFYHSFPMVPLRLAVPFIKSFFGRTIADGIHCFRKRLVGGRLKA
jgi:glycosyltransferase involved in cell wall biosynthesis